MVLAMTIFSCKKEDKQFAISGNIENFKGAKVFLQLPTIAKNFKVDIDSLGAFKYQMDQKEAVYGRLIINKLSVPVYVKNNTDVKLKINLESLAKADYSSIKVSGENILETKMMLDFYTKQDYPQTQPSMVLSPDDFVKRLRKAQKHNLEIIDNFVKENSSIDKEFAQNFKYQFQITLAAAFLYYPQYHSMMVPSDKTPIPADFNFFAKELPLNDLNVYNNVYRYKTYEVSIWNLKIMSEVTNPQVDIDKFAIEYLEKLKSYNLKEQINNDVANNYMSQFFPAFAPETQQKVKELYKTIQTNPNYLKNIK